MKSAWAKLDNRVERKRNDRMHAERQGIVFQGLMFCRVFLGLVGGISGADVVVCGIPALLAGYHAIMSWVLLDVRVNASCSPGSVELMCIRRRDQRGGRQS